MDSKTLFKKYQQRLVFEAIIKSLVCGFIIGFVASIVPAIICIIYNASGLWYCLAVAFGIGAIASAIFYFVVFKPTLEQVANRIDRLGLQERAITMMELEKDNSNMAKLQREDAQAKIDAANAKGIRFRVFKLPLIALAVVGVLAIGLTTFSIFSVEPMIPFVENEWQGDRVVDDGIEYITIRYEAYEGFGGDIFDYHTQVIPKGSDAETVVAVPWPGYQFVAWRSENGDMYAFPERTDRKLQGNMVFLAYFMQIPEVDPNQPVTDSEAMDWDSANTILDGNKYYGDYFDPFYEEFQQLLINSGNDLSPQQRAATELYFEMLLKLREKKN